MPEENGYRRYVHNDRPRDDLNGQSFAALRISRRPVSTTTSCAPTGRPPGRAGPGRHPARRHPARLPEPRTRQLRGPVRLSPMGGGLAAGDVWLPTRTDGLLWLRGGIVYVAWRRRHMRAVVQCPAYAGLILGGRAVCARHGGQRSLFFPPGRLPGADPVPGSAGVDDDLPAVPGGVVGLEPDAADCACVVAEVLIGAWLPDDRLEG